MAAVLVTTIKRFLGTAAEMAALNVVKVPAGSTFFQTDTGLLYNLDSAGFWAVKKTQLAALPAGTAAIGKVSIDQTTPGTTNKVVAELSGSYLTVDPETGAGTVTTTAADHSITDDNPVPIRLTGGNVKKAFAITPDDSADLIVNALSLSCIEEGVVYVDFIEGGSNLPIKLIPGSWNPVNVKKVYATNTTATGIIGQEI